MENSAVCVVNVGYRWVLGSSRAPVGDLPLVVGFPGNQGKRGSSIVGKQLKMCDEMGKRIMKEDGGD